MQKKESPKSQAVKGRDFWEKSLENKEKVPGSKTDNIKILSEKRKMTLKEDHRCSKPRENMIAGPMHLQTGREVNA